MSNEIAVAVTVEQAVELVACPSCKAKRGEGCHTPGKRPAPMHAPRYEAAKEYRREAAKLEAWNAQCRGNEPPAAV